jgi:hypothetical protein
MVAQMAGHNTSEHVVETTALGGDADPACRLEEQEQRYAELLGGYAAEAPATLKTDKAKFHYLKGQYYQHSECAPRGRLRLVGGDERADAAMRVGLGEVGCEKSSVFSR